MFNTIKVYAFIDLTHIINEINYLLYYKNTFINV